MEQTDSKKLQLGRLVADALGEIERLSYSRNSRDRYRTTWKQLIEFSQRKGLGDEFSVDLVARFLEECRVRDQQTNAPSDGWRRHIAFEVKMLADFAKLPLLATYLGHVNLSGTQHYLHLTAELFPEITARADAAFGDVIPRRIEP
jgi:intergrase/recombinase